MTSKLTKRAFYDAIATALATRSWVRLPPGSDLCALLAKRSGALILTVGLIESVRQKERVTAELALAGHTQLTMSFPDAPRARQRVGVFLTPEERQALLEPDLCVPGARDAWWRGRTAENARLITEAIGFAEPRFLGQPGLAEEVEWSRGHQVYVARLAAVARTPVPPDHLAPGYPPAAWVEAAFVLLADAAPKSRRRFAEEVAADAWRTYCMLRG